MRVNPTVPVTSVALSAKPRMRKRRASRFMSGQDKNTRKSGVGSQESECGGRRLRNLRFQLKILICTASPFGITDWDAELPRRGCHTRRASDSFEQEIEPGSDRLDGAAWHATDEFNTPRFNATSPGASALVMFDVIAHTTVVAMRLRLNTSLCITTHGRRTAGVDP